MEKEGTVHAETHLSTSESAGLRLLAPPLALQGVSCASRAPLEEGVASVETAHLDGISDRDGPCTPPGPVPPPSCAPTALHPHPAATSLALVQGRARESAGGSGKSLCEEGAKVEQFPGCTEGWETHVPSPVQDFMGQGYLGPWKIRDTFFSSFLEAPVPQSISFLLPFLRKHILLWENETRELAPPGAEGR